MYVVYCFYSFALSLSLYFYFIHSLYFFWHTHCNFLAALGQFLKDNWSELSMIMREKIKHLRILCVANRMKISKHFYILNPKTFDNFVKFFIRKIRIAQNTTNYTSEKIPHKNIPFIDSENEQCKHNTATTKTNV